MALNVGSPIGSEAYTTAATTNAYANAYGKATDAAGNSGTGKTSFRYPLKRLESTSDYLEIKIFKYVPGGIDFGPPVKIPTAQQRLKAKQLNPEYYILLPIPQNITDSTSVDWGEDRINPLEAAGLGFAGSAMEIGTSPEEKARNAVNFLQQGSEVLKGNTKLQNAIQQVIAGRAVSSLGGNVSATGLISRTTGQVMNSNLELLFNGVNLRTFQFVFDLAPRSKKEAEEVKQIIRTFKKTMSARNGGAGTGTNSNLGLFIEAPSVYQLTYKTGAGKHKFLNTFKPCALSDISVNYTASGTYATYEDGTPVHLQMGLTFKEINPVYAEDYENDLDAKEGVGY